MLRDLRASLRNTAKVLLSEAYSRSRDHVKEPYSHSSNVHRIRLPTHALSSSGETMGDEAMRSAGVRRKLARTTGWRGPTAPGVVLK